MSYSGFSLCGRLLKRAVTLLELLIAVALVGLLILGITTLDTYARSQLVASNRRVLLQNELSYVLDDMNKNIIRATGDICGGTDSDEGKGIRDIASCPSPPAGATIGFCVRVDNNNPYTYVDDEWIYYFLPDDSEKIQKQVGAGGSPENLNKNDVIVGFEGGGTGAGDFTFPDGGGVDVTLTGRYTASAAASMTNPQLRIKTKIHTCSASMN